MESQELKEISNTLIPKHGLDEKNIVPWIDRVEKLKLMYNLSDEKLKCLVTRRLKGKARDWYYFTNGGIFMNWEELKRKLVTIFSTSKENHKNTLVRKNHEFCVFLMDFCEKSYDVEALLDSGSVINLMTLTTWLNHFSKYPLERYGEGKIWYGGVNKSPITIHGYSYINVRIDLLKNLRSVRIRFAIVADSTMSYQALLGQEFIKMPGLIVTFNKTIQMEYCEP